MRRGGAEWPRPVAGASGSPGTSWIRMPLSIVQMPGPLLGWATVGSTYTIRMFTKGETFFPAICSCGAHLLCASLSILSLSLFGAIWTHGQVGGPSQQPALSGLVAHSLGKADAEQWSPKGRLLPNEKAFLVLSVADCSAVSVSTRSGQFGVTQKWQDHRWPPLPAGSPHGSFPD